MRIIILIAISLILTGCFESRSNKVKMNEIQDKGITEILGGNLNLSIRKFVDKLGEKGVSLIKYDKDKTIYIIINDDKKEKSTYSVGPAYPKNIEDLPFKNGWGMHDYSITEGKLYSRSDHITLEKFPNKLKEELELYIKIIKEKELEMDRKEKYWASREK